MTLIKRLKNFGEKALIGTLIGSALALGACGKKDSPAYIPPATCQNPDQNLPETFWVEDYSFQDLTTGRYEIPVYSNPEQDVKIKPVVNEVEWTLVSSGTLLDIPIIQGVNTLEAIAYNECTGKEDPTPAEFPNIAKGFYSPTENEARTLLIDGILQSRGYVEGVDYDKDFVMRINGVDILVDYRFKNPDSSTKGVVNYVSHSNNLQIENNNKNLLDNASIPNLYLARVPIPNPENPQMDLDLVTGNVNNFLDYWGSP